MRSAKQKAAQLKAAKVSAAKRRKKPLSGASVYKSSSGTARKRSSRDFATPNMSSGNSARAQVFRQENNKYQKAANMTIANNVVVKSKVAGLKKLSAARFIRTTNNDYTEMDIQSFPGVSGRNRKLANKIAGSKVKSAAKIRYSRRSTNEE